MCRVTTIISMEEEEVQEDQSSRRARKSLVGGGRGASAAVVPIDIASSRRDIEATTASAVAGAERQHGRTKRPLPPLPSSRVHDQKRTTPCSRARFLWTDRFLGFGVAVAFALLLVVRTGAGAFDVFPHAARGTPTSPPTEPPRREAARLGAALAPLAGTLQSSRFVHPVPGLEEKLGVFAEQHRHRGNTTSRGAAAAAAGAFTAKRNSLAAAWDYFGEEQR